MGKVYTKQEIYERNMKILPWCYSLLNTPIYFFGAIYMYYITNSFLLVGAIYSIGEIVKLFSEVPTGVISDKYLRRKGTWIMADIFHALGSIFYLLALYDWKLLFIGECLYGISLAFYSGNSTSFIHNTLSGVRKDNEYISVFSNLSSKKYLYWCFSILIAGIIGNFLDVKYVILYCACQKFLSAIIVSKMHEPSEYKKDEKKSLKAAGIHIIKAYDLLKNNNRLLWISLVAVLRYSFTAINQLKSLFYKSIFSLFHLGAILFVSILLASYTIRLSSKLKEKLGYFKMFAGINLLIVPLQLVGYFIMNKFSPIFLELADDVECTLTPAQSALLHKEFSDEQRATMESLISLLGAICFSLFAMLIGGLADTIGLSKALMLAVSLKLVIIPVLYKALKEKKES